MTPPTFKCPCGADTAIEPPGGPAVCPACCEDHEYVYERGEGWRCVHCFAEPPPDWYDDWDQGHDPDAGCLKRFGN